MLQTKFLSYVATVWSC